MSLFDLQSLHSNANTPVKKFKDSGIKKVFIIEITPHIPENYINVKKLWLGIRLHQVKHNFTVGLMNHSSMHPCCWCDIDKYHLHKKGNQRTFASLYELFWNYFDAKAKKAKDYGNVIHLPTIDIEDENMPVIHKVPL